MDDLATWVSVGTVAVIAVGGHIISWSQFKALVEANMKACRDDIEQLERQQQQFITNPSLDKMQADCRANIAKDIYRLERDQTDLKQLSVENAKALAQIPAMIAEIKSDIKHLMEKRS